ncbi:IQ and AAA domain-containing protein 1-like [Drosophila busckii]|nr:IQ and AAA domain-containing protein 1-like [Drosophila busckii]
MSFDLNHKLWIAANKEIGQLIKKQNRLKKIEPPEEKAISFKIFSELYVLYVELVNKLCFIYQHTFQVQKRTVVRTLVENATQQLMKLKEELKSMELNEYIYIDKVLISRKLTPRDLMIWRSPQFLYRRPLDIQNILAENKLYMNDEEKEISAAKDWEKVSEAIELIQAHERARRARVYKSNIKYNKKQYLEVQQRKKVNYRFTFKPNQAMSIPVKRTIFNADFIKTDEGCRDLRMSINENRDDLEDEEEQMKLNEIREKAASVIQSWWRAYKTKKIYKIKKQFKREMLGFKKVRKLKRPNQFKNSVLEMYKNEQLKAKLDEDFLNLINDERTRLLQLRSPWMMEDISDHIRAWFQEFYEKTMNFHAYPDPIKKGTVLVVIDETMTPLEFQETLNKKPMTKEEKKKQQDKKKAEKKKLRDKIKKEKIKEAKRRKKLKDAGIIDVGYVLASSKPIENIEKTIKQFSIDWRNIDEYLNKNHAPIKDWVIADELAKIHQELRELVDEYMRVEYELLRQALAKDQKVPYKPQKVKRAKAKKGKKKKKAVITDERPLSELYEELKDAGIIETISHKDFDEFIADFNFLADDSRDEDNLTTVGPAKADIKMVIEESMLGMSEFNITKPKSILLIGPLNSGKKLLCNIIASEIDAVFINLSPEKIFQYADNMNKFLALVMKVAKAFQPTILYIEEAHRVFIKKITPDIADINPRLIGSYINKKILKPIKPSDKIILLGTSNTPWAAKGGLKKAFQTTLLIPKCDYGTSFLLWLDLMTENAPDDMESYAYSALAKVLQAYNSGDITNNIAETLNVDRKMRLKSEALDPREFLEHFLSVQDPALFPPDAKLMDKFTKWFGKSNKFEKMRRKFLAAKAAKQKKK